MARFKVGILVSALALATGGCVAQGRVSGGFVATSDPTLVEIHPGVWVIEDYSEPVFYADGFYWLYRDDVWFRSSYHTGGWVRYRSAPNVIVRLERPRAYVHYHAASGVRVRQGPRGRAMVRDHRDDRPPAAHDRRDVRDDHRQDKGDKPDDKQEKGDHKPGKRDDKDQRHKHKDN